MADKCASSPSPHKEKEKVRYGGLGGVQTPHTREEKAERR
jgi:hypothetical protein